MADVARSCEGIGADQRGAILVPALVMGALMTGALFYVAAVGDAIMFRTQLQDAADVSSFQSAVWHARGLNVIASLNLLMTVALGIFAVLRMVRVVLFFIPVLNVAAGALQTAEEAVFPFIKTALTVIEGAQKGVSAAVPYVGFVDAKNTPTSADTIWPLSVSLVPVPAGRLTAPASLPVQAGDFGLLCGRSAMAAPNMILSILESQIPDWLGFLRGRISSYADIILDDVGPRVFGLGDGIFCQPLRGGVTRILGLFGDELCDAAEQHASEDEEAEEQQQEEEGERDGGAADGGTRRPRRTEASRGGVSCDQIATVAQDASTFTSVPAIIWSKAKNGNAAMHVWSWAQGQPRMFQQVQRGVAIADRGRSPTVTPDESAEAMSEFYFDCDTEWSQKCEEDAPWAPNWTARVRRFRHPVEEMQRIALDSVTGLLDALEQSVGEHVSEITGDALHELTGLPADNPITQWLGDRVNEMPLVRQISDRLTQAVGSARAASGIDALLDPRRYTEQERIH